MPSVWDLQTKMDIFVISVVGLNKCGGNETKTISECAYNNRPNSQYRLNRIERSVR